MTKEYNFKGKTFKLKNYGELSFKEVKRIDDMLQKAEQNSAALDINELFSMILTCDDSKVNVKEFDFTELSLNQIMTIVIIDLKESRDFFYQNMMQPSNS